MGCLQFTITGSNLGLTCVEGKPWFLEKFEQGIDPYAKGLGAIGTKAIPTELEMAFRAMQIAPPLAEIGQFRGRQVPSSLEDAVFGTNRSYAWLTYLPTELVIHGQRAWTVLQQWDEGGGENWKGDPIRHRAYVAGAWLDDELTQVWAMELAEHPLGKLLLAQRDAPKSIVLPTGTDPSLWSGVEVKRTSHILMETNDMCGTIKEPGVYRQLDLRYGNYEGTAYVAEPDQWAVTKGSAGEWPITPRFDNLVARNGREEKRFTRLEGLDEIALQKPPFFTAFAAELKGDVFVTPTDASGEWATFWPGGKDEWERFARTQNIQAAYRSALYGPEDYKGEYFIALSQPWAEKAWAAGATKLPAESVLLKAEDFEDRGSKDGWRVLRTQSPLLGAQLSNCGTIFLASRGVDSFHGWVRVTGLPVSHGAVVREVGDDSRANTELTVFTDGRVK